MKTHFRIVTLIAFLLAAGTATFGQVTSDITLVIRNNGSGVNAGQDTLHFGVNPAGTNGRDVALGEIEQPPAPPSPVFDIRWVNVGSSNNFGEGVKKNFRASTSPTQADTFRIKLQAGTGGFPVVISWPNLTSYFGTAQLRYFDNIAGANVNVNMISASQASVSDPDVTTLTIYTTGPKGPVGGVAVTPSPLNFGAVSFPLPGTKTDSLTITNSTAGPASITSVVSSNGAFVVATPPTFPLTLPSGASTRVGIVFTAPGPGVETSTITVTHNQPGSPVTVLATAGASSGQGLYLHNTLNTVNDNQAGTFSQVVGLKHASAIGVQGIQFKLTAQSPALKIVGLKLGSSVPNPPNWIFDYNITLAASGSEIQVLLFGRDSTINFAAGSYDSLFQIKYAVRNITLCDGAPGGDTVRAWMYLNDVQSSLANSIGTSAGITPDPERDSSQFNIHNSSARGDVNCDDHVDILDLLDIIDVIIGRSTFALWQKNRADLAPWSLGWGTSLVFSDANNYGDNRVNVQDATLMSNAILAEKWPDNSQLYGTRDGGDGGSGLPADITSSNSSSSSGSSDASQIFDVKFTFNVTQNGIHATMNNLVPVKGIQLKFAAVAPTDMMPEILSSLGDRFTLQQKIVDGEIRLLMYSLSGDTISPSTIDIFNLPFTIADPMSVSVIDPIIVGGAHNEGLLVEYEVIRVAAGVDPQGAVRSLNFTASPNPIAAGRGRLAYTLPRTSSVSLSIADPTGGEVLRLVDNERQPAGEHTVDFDATGLSNGTYFGTISLDGLFVSRTIIVIR
jgi:hypothetical protein